MTSITIIGNGIAGITTAIQLRKLLDVPIMVISDEAPYFFSRTALMYVYMGQLKFQQTEPYERGFWIKNNITLKSGKVLKLDSAKRQLHLENGELLEFDKLVIASGSVPNRFDWPGQELEGVSGLYHKKDLDYIEKISPKIKKAVIVGGGLIGIELAEMLRHRNIEVSFLVRESGFWNNVLPKEEAELINSEIHKHGIDLRLNTELKSIIGSEKVEAVLTADGEKIDCQFVGLTAGVRPNINFLKDSGIEVGKGVLVNQYLETNIPNIYAVGDCAENTEPVPGHRSIEAVWYCGRMMGETLALTLSGRKTAYNPGPWFNSAKFFGIEYQVYGRVSNCENYEEKHIYKEDTKRKKSLRISYNPINNQFLGIHSLGMRLRHEVFDALLRQNASLDDVLKVLKKANFDPEFSKKLHS
jgi:NAD(P)H-nitrite reductase large subunit